MSRAPWLSWHRLSILVCMILCGASLNACRSGDRLPDPSSKTYRDAVAAFYTSLAAIQAGVEVIAEEKMLRVAALVPQEPAAWANLGLLALRRTAFDLAANGCKKRVPWLLRIARFRCCQDSWRACKGAWRQRKGTSSGPSPWIHTT